MIQPSATSKFALETHALSVITDDKSILNNITLQVPHGAVVGLIGRNGAGKSTLLRALVGLTTPTRGDAELLGCDSKDLNDDVLGRLGFVAQTPDLFEWMSAEEHIKTIGEAYPRWTMERALILAARLHLPMGRKIKHLSLGDQQKLAVVLALMNDPDVLLCDEPVASLDPITRRDFMRSLFVDRTMSDNDAERERTIVISSHLLTDLERVVSHVAFIRDGCLQLFEAWDAVLEHYRLVPLTSAIPAAAVVFKKSRAEHAVVDTRLLNDWDGNGRVLSLDEMFMELNA
jgi:ABC-2 type transport system ATP-binding protein